MHVRTSTLAGGMVVAAAAALLVGCAGGGTTFDGAGAEAGAGDDGGGLGSPSGDGGAGAADAAHGQDGGAGGKEGGTTGGGDAGAASDAGSGGDATDGGADGGGSGDAGGGADAAAPDGGDAGGDAGATTDPFDPQSCPGQPLTEAQAATFFQAGATQAVVGSYTIEMRQRSCNSVTGCGPWGTPTTGLGAVLGGGTQPLTGTILLNVQGSSVVLTLQDRTEELPYFMGSTCSAVDGTPETCGAYSYDIGDQWGGSGGLFPTMGELTDQSSANVLLSGVITTQCLRLAYAAKDSSGNDVQQFVLLAPVAPGAPPPPNPCPGGGTQMACGSQAPGQTTCCQNGLTTCPQSGCDCWGACQ